MKGFRVLEVRLLLALNGCGYLGFEIRHIILNKIKSRAARHSAYFVKGLQREW